MAGSMKAIKNRIKSIESTKQITKAMELVATSKLRHAKETAEKTKPFFETLKKAMDDIARNNVDFSSPFCQLHAEKPVCHIVIAGDRGLAGGYNNNLFKSVNLKDGDIVFPIGKKAVEYFSKRNVTIVTDTYNIVDDISILDCHNIARTLTEQFKNGSFGALRIEYTKFVNVLSQIPASDEILPIIYDSNKKPEKRGLIIYEPSAESAFDHIIPQYISGVIYGAVSSSLASELSARRNAMQSANKNADEMISSLSLEYNRARQGSITQELTEIVAGANN